MWRRRVAGVPVRPLELFVDLVFVFAVTQLSHGILAHPTPAGAAGTLLLLLAVWWAWMYTAWTTNWFEPDHPAVRLLLLGGMLAGLVMAAAIPDAYGPRAAWFAGAYVTLQVGRALFVAVAARRAPLGPTFRRILCWQALSGALWLAGGLAAPLRVPLWLLAVACEYTAPWHGYATPLLGRSRTADWSVDGGHLAERCQLFLIIALGESVLLAGASFAVHRPTAYGTGALGTVFAGIAALWWIYFGRPTGTAAEPDDPGRLARSAYTYLHLPMVAGIILCAVAGELVIAHPTGHPAVATALATLGGPALFVAGHALFARTVTGRLPRGHPAALAALVLLAPASAVLPPLALSATATAVLVALATAASRRPGNTAGTRTGAKRRSPRTAQSTSG